MVSSGISEKESIDAVYKPMIYMHVLNGGCYFENPCSYTAFMQDFLYSNCEFTMESTQQSDQYIYMIQRLST